MRVLGAMIILLWGSVANAATIYVSSNGSDSHAGTSTKPFYTIQKALDTAKPGDTVKISQGIYHESILIHHGGTDAEPITIRGDGANRTILDGSILTSTEWTTCGKHLYRMHLNSSLSLDGIILWEANERLISTNETPKKPGTFFVTDQTEQTPIVCDEGSETNENRKYVYLRPLHPTKHPKDLRIHISSLSTFIRTSANEVISNIVIRDIGFRRGAGANQGIIALQNATDWRLRRLSFMDNGSIAISLSNVSNIQILDSEFSSSSTSYAGGIASQGALNLQIERNYIHDNHGPGIWLAAGDQHTARVTDNLLRANAINNIHVGPGRSNSQCVGTNNTLIQGNVIVGAYSNNQKSNAGGITLQPAGRTHVRENLFLGNQHALLFDEANSISSLREAAALNELCGENGPETSLMENMLLHSFGAHIRKNGTSSETFTTQNNVYSEEKDFVFLQGLFFGSKEVREDPLYLQYAAAKDLPATFLLSENPLEAAVIPWLNKNANQQFFDFENEARITPTETVVLNGQFPFIYSPQTVEADKTHERLMLIRLNGGRGTARIYLRTSETTSAKEMGHTVGVDVQATWNGRILPILSDKHGQITIYTSLAPWQNWLVLRVPPQKEVSLIRVTKTKRPTFVQH